MTSAWIPVSLVWPVGGFSFQIASEKICARRDIASPWVHQRDWCGYAGEGCFRIGLSCIILCDHGMDQYWTADALKAVCTIANIGEKVMRSVGVGALFAIAAFTLRNASLASLVTWQ